MRLPTCSLLVENGCNLVPFPDPQYSTGGLGMGLAEIITCTKSSFKACYPYPCFSFWGSGYHQQHEYHCIELNGTEMTFQLKKIRLNRQPKQIVISNSSNKNVFLLSLNIKARIY